MGKGKGITFTLFAILGAVAGYASYMAKKDEFSDETKDKYDIFVNKAKNVGTDIQRTYTSIGDKSQFTNNTKNLSNSARKLASRAGDLVMSATSDIYNSARNHIVETIENAKSDINSSKTSSNSKVTLKSKSNKTSKNTKKKPNKKS